MSDEVKKGGESCNNKADHQNKEKLSEALDFDKVHVQFVKGSRENISVVTVDDWSSETQGNLATVLEKLIKRKP